MVTQIDDPTSLNLILMDLKDDSITTTMYAAAYRTPAPPFTLGVGQTSKVDVMCDAVRDSLCRLNPNR